MAKAKAKVAPKAKAAPKAKPDIGAAVKGVLARATAANASDDVVYMVSEADYKMLEALVG